MVGIVVGDGELLVGVGLVGWLCGFECGYCICFFFSCF